MGAQHLVEADALGPAGGVVAKAHLAGGEQGRLHAGDVAAFVHKAHQRRPGVGAVPDHVLHDALLGLRDGEIHEAQGGIDGAGGVGDLPAQQLKGRAGEEHGQALLSGLGKRRAVAAQVLQHRFLAAFRAGAQKEEVGAGEVQVVAQGDLLHGDSVAQVPQVAAQQGHIGPVPVQAHKLGVQMQQFDVHVTPPPFPRCKGPCPGRRSR